MKDVQPLFNHLLLCSWAVAYIKTHGSESRGQEEVGHMRRMSELFTGTEHHSEIIKCSK